MLPLRSLLLPRRCHHRSCDGCCHDACCCGAGALRKWVDEIRSFAPARTALGHNNSEGHDNNEGATRAPLLARGSSLSTWKDEMVLIDETLFCRLLADLDHIARLRDNGHTLGALSKAFHSTGRPPRGAKRLGAELCARGWESTTEQTLANLRALTAAAAARASTFARAELNTAISAATDMRSILARAVGDPSANSADDRRENRRGDPGALSAEPPLAPVSEWSAISPWNSPSRDVYRAYDLEAREGRWVAVVRVPLPKGGADAWAAQRIARTYAEHAALEVSAAKSLSKATATFTRAIALSMVPPTPRQPCYEARIIYERLDAHRHVPALLRLHGALEHAERSPVVRIWGRQILLALKAAHEVIFAEIIRRDMTAEIRPRAALPF